MRHLAIPLNLVYHPAPMTAINAQQAAIAAAVEKTTANVIHICNRVSNTIGILGFERIEEANPTIESLSRILDFQALPLLDQLNEHPEILPQDSMRVDNVRQYCWHLRRISDAIKNNSQEDFESAVKALDAEPMPL